MPEKIPLKEVRRIAHLARLALSDEQCARYQQQLSTILTYMDKLSEADTAAVAPTAHPHGARNVMRDDEPGRPLGVEGVLANAPVADAPFFKVPKVLGANDNP